jgi:hypothetical protein
MMSFGDRAQGIGQELAQGPRDRLEFTKNNLQSIRDTPAAEVARKQVWNFFDQFGRTRIRLFGRLRK